MNTQRVGSRGFIFTFDDGISLYLIAGSRFHLLCDSHLGPESIHQIQEFMKDDPRPDRMIVFNSHADWDHIWGNCSFPDSMIIGHESCRTRMIERGEYDLRENRSLARGMVRIQLPNMTFSDRLTLEDEAIEFFHTPGHTIDSASCYDKQDTILYLGDLVEDPIPYLDAENLDTYLDTLRSLISHPAQTLITAHSGIISRDLIRKNMAYISGIRDRVPMDDQSFGAYASVHRWNLNQRIVLRYANLLREREGASFSYIKLLAHAGDLHEIAPGHLEKNLAAYLESG